MLINTIIYELAGFALVILTLILLPILLIGKTERQQKRYTFKNFFIADNNRYSPIRLQAVIWAIVIIASQISVLLALANNTNIPNALSLYRPVFPETVLWLLGLSLSSYVAIKGITINDLNSGKITAQSEPKLSDFIIGDNGLDFGRCQMLMWTAIGIILYISNNVNFVNILSNLTPHSIAKGKTLLTYFTVDSGEFKAYFPTLSSSFIVLMGISQGTYVGKNLLPSIKSGQADNAINALGDATKDMAAKADTTKEEKTA